MRRKHAPRPLILDQNTGRNDHSGTTAVAAAAGGGGSGSGSGSESASGSGIGIDSGSGSGSGSGGGRCSSSAAAAAAAAATPPAAAAHGRRGGSPTSAAAAETAMHAASPGAHSGSPISQVSEPSQHFQPTLTSRFAATKRPQTGKRTHHPGSDLQHPHLPPQLQLGHDSPPNDPFLVVSSPESSPRHHHHQPPGPGSSANTPRACPEESRRPVTKGGFFHFSKPASRGLGKARIPTSLSLAPQDRREPTCPEGPGESVASNRSGDLSYARHHPQRPSAHCPSRSEQSLSSSGRHPNSTPDSPISGRRNKTKPFGLLSRARSYRDKGSARTRPTPISLPLRPSGSEHYGTPARTAPIAQDRAFRDMVTSSPRNRSEDRGVRRDSSRDKERGALPSSRENGSSFFSGLRSSSTKAADIISKGLFGKSSRSGSTSEREPVVDDEHYVLRVMNLPLVEQTRKTRISKRLESSRDKTEFWMPAFPWRAIDYLNYKGCDVEGLYRVPGSGPQIKKWQRKFDEQCDVDLFKEDSLYDINIVGSMLKAWLRELPDELFPKEAQDRIARQCPETTQGVPQMLIDELSNLPPFNYYLLFAITCHLSLLLAHSEKNKMDYTNLCICFQPCMKIDAFCFKFLVTQWRDCWKGCKNEAQYIEEEYRLFDQPPPPGVSEPKGPAQNHESYPLQPTPVGNSKPSNFGSDERFRGLQFSDSNISIGSKASSISTNVTTDSVHETSERTRDLRPLSPIKPLSPIGF